MGLINPYRSVGLVDKIYHVIWQISPYPVLLLLQRGVSPRAQLTYEAA